MNKLIALIFAALTLFLSPALEAETKKDEARVWIKSPYHKYIAAADEWLNTQQTPSSEDFMGRIILLNFWNASCVSCINIRPDLEYLEEEFANNLTIIDVHSAKFISEKNLSTIKNAILKHDLNRLVINDAEFKIWSKFGVHSWPSFALLAPNGQVYSRYSGEGNLSKLENDIYSLIEEFGDDIVKSPLAIEAESGEAPYLKYPTKLEYVEDFESAPAIFIADSGNNRVVAVRLDGEVFLEIGSGDKGLKNGDIWEAEFNFPQGLLYREGILYVADTNNHSVRAVNFKKERVTTIAGTGFKATKYNIGSFDALSVEMASPWDLALYPEKDNMAISVAGLNQIWDYDFDQKTLTAIAGSGAQGRKSGRFPSNSLAQPAGFSVCDKKLYFTDAQASALRVLGDGEVVTLIGQGLFKFGHEAGRFNNALMQYPLGLYCDKTQIYIADSYNNSIRQYDKKNNFLRNYSGSKESGDKIGKIKLARYNEPNDIIKIGNSLYISDTNNHKIKILNLDSKMVSEFEVITPEYEEITEEPTDDGAED